MEAFTSVTGVAAPLLRDNIDTDALLPKQFLKTIARQGLGNALLYDLRFDASGAEKPDFVLNQGVYRQAKFLVTGANFGCGSSREHAPWALADFGIRAVVGISFADIFAGNCTKNGIVPVVLPEPVIAQLIEALRDDPELTVDLENESVSHRVVGIHSFRFDAFRRSMLLRGMDDVAWTEERGEKINAFEASQRAASPWLYLDSES